LGVQCSVHICPVLQQSENVNSKEWKDVVEHLKAGITGTESQQQWGGVRCSVHICPVLQQSENVNSK
jgi:hypothetical protein